MRAVPSPVTNLLKGLEGAWCSVHAVSPFVRLTLKGSCSEDAVLIILFTNAFSTFTNVQFACKQQGHCYVFQLQKHKRI